MLKSKLPVLVSFLLLLACESSTNSQQKAKAYSGNQRPLPPAPVKSASAKPVIKKPSVKPAAAGESDLLLADGLPERLLIGFWQNFDTSTAKFVKLSEVAPPVSAGKAKWDIISVAFAESIDANHNIGFKPFSGYASDQAFKDDVKKVQAQGQKVLIAIGGGSGPITLDNDIKTTNFVNSVSKIITDFGFNGVEIDFAGQSVFFEDGDTDINAPTSPTIVNTIKALNDLRLRFGKNFVISLSPETFFVQTGFEAYGALGNPDKRAGAFLPIIQALNKNGNLTLLHVQNYNSGPVMGLDEVTRAAGTAEFTISMVEMLIQGFAITNNTDPKLRFDGVSAEKVALGLPATADAGSGFITNAETKKAFLCLQKGQSCPFPLKNVAGYSDLRGIMSWNINWDTLENREFSDAQRTLLDSL